MSNAKVESPKRGFQHGGIAGDLFSSAAVYYAQFRRSYPSGVVSYLVDECRLDGAGRLLDIGCGTGQVFSALEVHFQEIVAIDPDREMLEHAQRSVDSRSRHRVQFRQITAEQIGPELGVFRMAVCGASFHWMDRPRVAELVYDQLEPGGIIALLMYSGLHDGVAEWEKTIVRTLGDWLGPERRAGGGIFQAGERHEAVLARSRFGPPRMADILVDEVWTIDEIIGFLYSTSYASKAVLGERAPEFELELRRRLRSLVPPEGIVKRVEYTIITAQRAVGSSGTAKSHVGAM
jgi:SAM-dependent methyltransferase